MHKNICKVIDKVRVGGCHVAALIMFNSSVFTDSKQLMTSPEIYVDKKKKLCWHLQLVTMYIYASQLLAKAACGKCQISVINSFTGYYLCYYGDDLM